MFEKTQTISDIIKKQVVENAINQAEVNKYRMKQNISPSMDFKCMTQTWFRFKYSGGNFLDVNPSEFSYENERAKVVGEAFHSYMQSQFKKAGILRLNELPLRDEKHHISARIDSVVEIDDVLYLVELKSIQQYPFEIMANELAPDIDHQKQIQIYFHLLELNKNLPEVIAVTKGRKINKGILFYENKNRHRPMEFVVNRNQEQIDEILDFCNVLWEHIQTNKKPKYKFALDSFECKYCKPEFFLQCHGKPQPPRNIEDKNVWGIANVREVKSDASFKKNA